MIKRTRTPTGIPRARCCPLATATRISFNALATMVLSLLSMATAAEWAVYAEAPHGVEFPSAVAIVFDGNGNSFRIYADDENTVRGIFSIRDGFDTFADSACPTYQVDAKPPLMLRFRDNSCRLEGKRAHFTFGVIEEATIRSRSLKQLLSGSEVAFRYKLHGVGYRETRFSLEGLRAAMDESLDSVAVIFTP